MYDAILCENVGGTMKLVSNRRKFRRHYGRIAELFQSLLGKGDAKDCRTIPKFAQTCMDISANVPKKHESQPATLYSTFCTAARFPQGKSHSNVHEGNLTGLYLIT